MFMQQPHLPHTIRQLYAKRASFFKTNIFFTSNDWPDEFAVINLSDATSFFPHPGMCCLHASRFHFHDLIAFKVKIAPLFKRFRLKWFRRRNKWTKSCFNWEHFAKTFSWQIRSSKLVFFLFSLGQQKINFQSTLVWTQSTWCIKMCVTLPINGLAQLEEEFFRLRNITNRTNEGHETRF